MHKHPKLTQPRVAYLHGRCLLWINWKQAQLCGWLRANLWGPGWNVQSMCPATDIRAQNLGYPCMSGMLGLHRASGGVVIVSDRFRCIGWFKYTNTLKVYWPHRVRNSPRDLMATKIPAHSHVSGHMWEELNHIWSRKIIGDIGYFHYIVTCSNLIRLGIHKENHSRFFSSSCNETALKVI